MSGAIVDETERGSIEKGGIVKPGHSSDVNSVESASCNCSEAIAIYANRDTL